MCKYCEKLENGKSQKAIFEDDHFIIQIDTDTPIGKRRGCGSTMRIFDGSGETEINISYCPMCGRKLNMDKKEQLKDHLSISLKWSRPILTANLLFDGESIASDRAIIEDED